MNKKWKQVLLLACVLAVSSTYGEIQPIGSPEAGVLVRGKMNATITAANDYNSKTNSLNSIISGFGPLKTLVENNIAPNTTQYSFYYETGPTWHLNHPSATFEVVDIGGPILGLSSTSIMLGKVVTAPSANGTNSTSIANVGTLDNRYIKKVNAVQADYTGGDMSITRNSGFIGIYATGNGANLDFYADGAIYLYSKIGIDLGNKPLYGVSDPTMGTHVGDRDYNDANYAKKGKYPIFAPFSMLLGYEVNAMTMSVVPIYAKDIELKASVNNFSSQQMVYWYDSRGLDNTSWFNIEYQDRQADTTKLFFTLNKATSTEPRMLYYKPPLGNSLHWYANGDVVREVSIFPDFNMAEQNMSGWMNPTNSSVSWVYALCTATGIEEDAYGKTVWRPCHPIGWSETLYNPTTQTSR
jgi:hypothetical protein